MLQSLSKALRLCPLGRTFIAPQNNHQLLLNYSSTILQLFSLPIFFYLYTFYLYTVYLYASISQKNKSLQTRLL